MDWKEQLSLSVTDEEQKIFIKFCTLSGYSPQETEDHLRKAIGDKAFPIELIENLQNLLKNGHNFVDDPDKKTQPEQPSPTLLQRVLSPIKSSSGFTFSTKEKQYEQDKYVNNFLYNGLKTSQSNEVSRKYLDKNYFAILNKALLEDQWLINEQAFEYILVHSYQSESSEQFWRFALENIYKKIDDKIDIHKICWKFLFLIHWLLRNGHPNCIKDAYGQRPLLIELSKIKKCISPQCCSFAQLNQLYFALLFQKIEFHMEHAKIPGNLVVNEKLLDNIGSTDLALYEEICMDLFDYMDKILALQSKVFQIRGLTTTTSPYSKCILNPLKICIIESGQIYDIIFRIMQELHKNTAVVDTLQTCRNRFANQFQQLRLFYLKCQEYVHLKDSIQIPELVDQPPDFTKSIG